MIYLLQVGMFHGYIKLTECIFQNHPNLRDPHMEISSPESSKSWTAVA